MAVLAGGALLASGVGLCNAWVLRSARGRMFEHVEQVPSAPVAIVLGARVYADGPSITLRDRLAAALALYRAGKVQRILVSGDHRAHRYDEVNTMHAWLREQGVPDGDIFLDHAGFRTLDTMQRAARVFGVRRAVVCTQRFHLGRSLFLAEHAGIDAFGLVADRRTYRARRANLIREVGARTVAFGDALVWQRQPAVLGPPVPITGDSRASHDYRTGP